jgi:hypothetical protein
MADRARMGLQKIDSLLGAGEFRTLSAGARRIRELERAWQTAAPPALGAASHVRTCKAGTLVIVADNAAVAAKLRQMTGRLLAAVRTSATGVDAMRIEVGVDARAHAAGGSSDKAVLGAAAVEQFAALARRVPEGSLKQALDQLVKRRKKTEE